MNGTDVRRPPSPTPPTTSIVAVVALGGALGATARWVLERELATGAGGFPWTTFAINVVGSALLATLPAVRAVRRRPLLPPLLGTGVLGGFTTLSAASEETRALLASGHAVTASAYLLGTLLASLAAVALAVRLTGPPPLPTLPEGDA